jgi:hypothetical protein
VTVYVFDTSAFIEAWWESYPPENFPGFWEEMDALVGAGNLIAPEEVLAELKSQDDDLHEWVKQRSADIVVPTSRDLMLEVAAILNDHATLTKPGTGRSAADPFVIALASIRSAPVVTKEQGGSAQKPRIPFVCGDRNVACMRLLEVIRAEGWTFSR